MRLAVPLRHILAHVVGEATALSLEVAEGSAAGCVTLHHVAAGEATVAGDAEWGRLVEPEPVAGLWSRVRLDIPRQQNVLVVVIDRREI